MDSRSKDEERSLSDRAKKLRDADAASSSSAPGLSETLKLVKIREPERDLSRQPSREPGSTQQKDGEVKNEPTWVTVEDAKLFHKMVIEAFGGSAGVRDEGLLESALAKAQNIFAYESQDLLVLAGAYAFGLAKNHPFVDGNKRIAFVTARVFLGMNDVDFSPPEAEAVVMVEGLASGELSQAEFTDWVRKHSKPA